MGINLTVPDAGKRPELKPKITVIGVGGAGGNAVNNMIDSQLEGVEFVVANTDSQALSLSKADRCIQLGVSVTSGLGAGADPSVGERAAEEAINEILEEIDGSNMLFVAAGFGGGTGTGAAPVVAKAARERGILTIGVVTKPFHFEGSQRMLSAEAGIEEMQRYVDTLIVIPNQNLFLVANEKTTFGEAFKMADDVLYSGVRSVTDLMVMPGLINLDFADVRTVMSEMGKAMMGTGEAEGERRALEAAERAISNRLIEDTSVKGACGVLINITGGADMTLFEVDEAANHIRDQVDPNARIIFGSAFDASLEGKIRVSVVATGIDVDAANRPQPLVLDSHLAVKASVAKPHGEAESDAKAAEQVPTTAAASLFDQVTEAAGHDVVAESQTEDDFVFADDLDDTTGEMVDDDDHTAAATSPYEDYAEAHAEEAIADHAPSIAEDDELQELPEDPEEDFEASSAAKPRMALVASRDDDAESGSADDENLSPLVENPMPSGRLAATGHQPFIPREPVSPRGGGTPADPYRAADMTNGGSRKSGAGGLFYKITGLTQRIPGGKTPSEEARMVKPPIPKAVRTPGQLHNGSGRGHETTVAVGHTAAATAEQLDLTPTPSERTKSSEEEDLLDIPAFLRRQAN